MDSVKLYTLLSFFEMCVGIEREREKREKRVMMITTTTTTKSLSLSTAMKNHPPVCVLCVIHNIK